MSEKPEFQWLEEAIDGLFSAGVAMFVGLITILVNLVCAVFGWSSDDDEGRTNE